jgi:hypothetical protein
MGMKMWRNVSMAMLTCVLAVLLIANTPASLAAGSRSRKYSPVYAPTIKASERQDLNTLNGSFAWAAQSSTLQTAVYRWKKFLEKYDRPEYEPGDNFEAQRIVVARYELMRVHYLLGDIMAGDRLMIKLDPLDLFPD